MINANLILPNLPKTIIDKLTLPAELVASHLVSKNPKCKHRNAEDKFTIMLTEEYKYKCSICGESHDKLAAFFVDNMAQGQVKEEEERNDA